MIFNIYNIFINALEILENEKQKILATKILNLEIFLKLKNHLKSFTINKEKKKLLQKRAPNVDKNMGEKNL